MKNADEPILFWVNCYGGWVPELRHPTETRGYDFYLAKVAEIISGFKGKIRDIYISGGMLDSKGRTECETTKPELEKRLKKLGVEISIKTDEDSITSISIVKNFLQTWREKYSDCRPIFFTDKIRYDTNAYAFECFVKKLNIQIPPTAEVFIGVEREDIHHHSTIEYQRKKLETMKKIGLEQVEAMGIKKRKG